MRLLQAFKVLLILLVLSVPLGVSAQDGGSEIQVGVVIQGADAQSQTYCVTLDEDAATGMQALQAAGAALIVEHSARGAIVCQIDATGCAFPDEHCFCQCMGGGPCAYWAYFHLGEAGNWQYSVQGAESYTLAHGDVEGWWWRDSANPDARLPAITFDAICGSAAGFPRVVEDGLGREVVLAAPPRRIASVTLATDEILLDLVGPERLLGVSHFADDPAISNVADRLDSGLRTDLVGNPEFLISLDADLVVLTTFNNPAALDQMLDADVPVFVLEGFNTLADVRSNIRLLGRVTGQEARADALVSEMDAQLDAIRQAIAGHEPVRVLYYEPGGITYGPGSTVDEIITLAGGINVVAEFDLGAYPVVNPEFLIAADPDVILLGGWFSDADNPLDWFMRDPVFSTLTAVQQGRVYPVNDAHFTTVSHYLVRGVEDVARLLYPDAFDETAEHDGRE